MAVHPKRLLGASDKQLGINVAIANKENAGKQSARNLRDRQDSQALCVGVDHGRPWLHITNTPAWILGFRSTNNSFNLPIFHVLCFGGTNDGTCPVKYVH